MRFLMLSWRDPENPKAGGAEDATMRYLLALKERGHETYWWSFQFPGSAEHQRVNSIPVIRKGGALTSILHARQWVSTEKPFDLIIDQHHGLPWFVPWWSATPCVAYIHEILGPIWHSFYPWPLAALGEFQEQLVLKFYKRIPFWTVSQSTRTKLLKLGVENVRVFSNGTHVQPLRNIDFKPLKTPVRFVTVSRLAPNKRIDHAILLMKDLESRDIDAALQIIGSGEELPRLQKLINRLRLHSKVQLLGRLSEERKNETVRQAHFLVHPSVREGWGLNVIEANAMGTPALVYPVAGLVDSTQKDVTGLVARNETPRALGDEIQNLLQTPQKYQELRANALDLATRLQWEKLVTPVCDWLESLAEKTIHRC